MLNIITIFISLIEIYEIFVIIRAWICYEFVTVNEIGEFRVKTKFIGLEGYNAIEPVSNRKSAKKSKKLNTAQKTVRFVRRAAMLVAKRFQKAAVKKTAKKNTSVLDRQYTQARRAPETAGSSAMESLSYLKIKAAGKPLAHGAPSEPRQHKFLKKKALLAAAACAAAITLSCVTVASALDVPKPVKEDEVKAPAAAVATADQVVYTLEAPQTYVNSTYATLSVDGDIIGTTDEGEALEQALRQYLADYRAEYDDTTTTEFDNDVQVERHGAVSGTVLSADELINAAKDRFSVRLETDWYYDSDIEYETEITYDEDEDSDYEKVVTEGKTGTVRVNMRLTYLNGEFVNADVTGTEVVSEPVTEELIRGSKQGQKEESGSSEGSGQFIWPFPHTHNITSLFEWRWGRMHQGIDIAGGDDYGQPVIAADSGKVTWAGNDGGGYGNYVMIDHGNGYMTVYGHGCEVACSTGDYVNQGDVIMYCGSTGNSTGPHVHFEIRVDDVQVDPLGYVS